MIVEELFTKLGFKVDPEGIEKGKKALSGFKKFIGGLALGAGFTYLAKTGLEAAMTMEGLSAQFKVMTGSAEGAAKIIQEISEFAAKTPFDKLGLSGAAKTLMAYGLEADKVVPTLRMLGDVAGSDQNKLNSLALVFGQIQSTGKLMGQDLLQLINQGFNPLTVISKKTGMSVSDLKDAMSEGAISADMVTLAFQAATSEGGLFFGNLEAQSQTLQGQISTLKDNFVTALQNMAEAFLPMLKAGTAALIAFDWTPIVAVVEDFGRTLSVIDFESVVKWVRRISEVALALATSTLQVKMIGALKHMGTTAAITFKAMTSSALSFQLSMFTLSKSVIASAKGIGKAMYTALGPIGTAMLAIEGFMAAYEYLQRGPRELQRQWDEEDLRDFALGEGTYSMYGSPEGYVKQQQNFMDIAKREMEKSAAESASGIASEAAIKKYSEAKTAFEEAEDKYFKVRGIRWEEVSRRKTQTPSMKTGDLDKAFASITTELQNAAKETKKNTKAVKDNTDAKKKELTVADLARQAFDANFNIKLKSLMVGSV